MDTSVRQILDKKGYEVHSISPDAHVIDALELMAHKGVGALLVMDEDRLVGVFSERDYARKIILKDRSSKEARVREIMTPRVLAVSPDRTTADCLMVMTVKRVRHLPVMQDNSVIGVISIGDVVNAQISSQQRTIEQLVRYIQGY